MVARSDNVRQTPGLPRRWGFNLPAVPSIPVYLGDVSGAWLWGQVFDWARSEVPEDLHQGDVRTLQPGRARTFDGIDDWVDFGGRVTNMGAGDLTAMCWVKTVATSCMFLAEDVAGNRQWFLGVDASGFLRLGLSGNGSTLAIDYSSQVLINDDAWHHVAFNWDGGVAMYVDGLIVETTKTVNTTITSIYDGTAALSIGAGEGGTADWFTGELFDVRLYPETIETEKVAAIHAAGTSGGRPDQYLYADYGNGLLLHTKLDESAGSTAYDSSGNANDGTYTGASLYENSDVPFSWRNEAGYVAAAPDTPIDSSAIGKNTSGTELDVRGQAPRNALLHSSSCATFDGTAHITGGARVTSGSPNVLSVAVWANSTSGNIASEYTSTGDQRTWKMSIVTDQLDVEVSGDGTTGNRMRYKTTATITGGWHHLAFVYAADDTLTVYIDGAAAAVTKIIDNTVTSLFNSSAHFAIGCTNASTTAAGQFVGDIADVRVFNAELSAADIAAIYADNPPSVDPIGWWPLAEGSGLTAYDAAGPLNGTGTATTWGTQDFYHHNLRRGFSFSGDVRIPGTLNGVAATGSAITNPAGLWHNNAETLMDFTGGEPDAPWLDGLSIPSAYAFGDDLPPTMVKRATATREDHFYVVSSPLYQWKFSDNFLYITLDGDVMLL